MELKILKNITKRELVIIAVTLIVGIIVGSTILGNKKNTKEQITETTTEHTIWTCSMHPQIRQDHPGKCPICGMELIPLTDMQTTEQNTSPDEVQISESAIKLADIQTYKVKKGVFNKEILLYGKVEPDETNLAAITARFSGRIEKLFVNYTGQNIYTGQKLATIYSTDLITAQQELIEAYNDKANNESLYQTSRNKLKLWGLTDKQIDEIIEKGEAQTEIDIYSPISGTVTDLKVAEGDYVKEGTPLMQIVNLSRVWVVFDAYETDLPWIKVGDNVNFFLTAMPAEEFSSKINFIQPFLNEKTRTADIRAEIANASGKFKLGMFVTGKIKSEVFAGSEKLLIPKTAVLWTGKRSIVYVKVLGREMPTFILREIKLETDVGNYYIVANGLNEGEEIATNGVFKIDAAAQLAGKPNMMNYSQSNSIDVPHALSDL